MIRSSSGHDVSLPACDHQDRGIKRISKDARYPFVTLLKVSEPRGSTHGNDANDETFRIESLAA
jgi:hypothetical protein